MHLKALLYFVVKHAFFAAFCALAMAYQTSLILDTNPNWYVLGFIFFATLCSYNFHFFVAKFYNGGVYKNLSLLIKDYDVIVMILAALGFCILYTFTSLQWWKVLLSFILTFLYTLPLIKHKWLSFLKKLGIIKTILLAFTWTYVTCYLPISNDAISKKIFSYWFLHRFLFMFVLCIIFDNRDIAIDKIRGLHSIATDINKQTLHYFVLGVLLCLFIMDMGSLIIGSTSAQIISLMVTTIMLTIVYGYSQGSKQKGYLFYYVVVDGLMIVSAIFLSIASI
jgi:4-hydroxybenzoate polyprenyltransferase